MIERFHLEEIDEIPEQDAAALDFLKKRLYAVAVILILVVGVIFIRLWFLQINNGDEYRDRAYNNRVRIRQLAAPRGDIVDRKGVAIVTNRPSFNVVLIREDSYDIENVLKKLSKVLDVELPYLWKQVRDSYGTPLYIPIRLQRDIDWNTLAYLENHNQDLPGIRIEVQPVRVYHHTDLAPHAIGYLGSISKKELQAADRTVYSGGDLVGKTGLEKIREADLRGEKGNSSSEVDAKGFEQQLLTNLEPLPGNKIQLTIDAEMQEMAEGLMQIGEKSGAVVAMEVKTGRLLVSASTPPIHLDQFVGGISTKNWKALLENSKHPLLNKAVQAAYPPGSTYKMITALAGLTTGVIVPSTTFFCSGSHKFGNRTYNCWKKGGHGEVDLYKALSESCDVFFYQVGQRVGVDGLAEVAHLFGLGERTGVELEHEKTGLVPTKAWKKKRYNAKWHEGETLSVAIGQGFNLATPLQICQMTAAIANGGKLFRPQIVEKVTDPDGKVVEQFKPELIRKIEGYSNQIYYIQQGMVGVIHGNKGTARNVKIEGLTIGGKTGTAQVVKVEQYRHLAEEDIPYKYRDHAWFTSFAPADDPEIAVTVLVEHGLHGGSGAGPIAKAVIKKYFEDRLPKPEPVEEPIEQ